MLPSILPLIGQGTYPLQTTSARKHTEMSVAKYKGAVTSPIQARWIYALPRSPMKSRSPRVVIMGRNPLRGTVGHNACHTPMVTSITPIKTKNQAVTGVQAIHCIFMVHIL
jgi:phosphoenolpyruvate carboxylase